MIGFPESIPCLSHVPYVFYPSLYLSLSTTYVVAVFVCILCIRRYLYLFLTRFCSVLLPFPPRPPPLHTYNMCDLCFLVFRFSGVVLWQVLTRRQPFEGLTPIQAAFSVARQGLRPPLPPSAPSALSSLIGRCWHRSPDIRPSFSQVRAWGVDGRGRRFL